MPFLSSVWPSGGIEKHPNKRYINWIRYSKWILTGVALVTLVLVMTVALALYLSPKEEVPKGAIPYIKERGHLIATLTPNTLDYFLYRGDPRGFGLDLLESFAKSLDVPMRILACTTSAQSWYYLRYHAADIIGTPVPETTEGKNLVHYTLPLLTSTLVLVQRDPAWFPNDTSMQLVRHLDSLPGDTIYVRQDLFFQPVYDSILAASGNRTKLILVPEIQEELFEQVSLGKIRYALMPEYIASILSRVFRNTDVSLVVSHSYPFCWAVNHPSDTLLSALDEWIAAYSEKGSLEQTFRDYYERSRVPKYYMTDHFSLKVDHISPWDDQIRRYSDLFWWDWRLIASLMYAESNFIPGKTSHKNAYGLMQMIPKTAAIYGLNKNSTPSEEIMAGIKYLKWIDDQLPPEIVDPRERASFTIASYNWGIGRVRGLRNRAIKYESKDPDKWHGHVEYYLLRDSYDDPYALSDTLRIFPPDYRKNSYVDEIVNRFYHYRNLVPY
jgi:membrane-bound lytic murein transglycosylase F